MVHFLHAVLTDAAQILGMLRAHGGHPLARLTGFVLVARTLDEDGTMRTHTLTMGDQPPVTTQRLMEDAQRATR